MTRQRLRLLLWVVLGAAVSTAAQAQDLNRVRGELKDIEADTEQLRRNALDHAQLRSPTHVEERLTDGELFFRLRDYVRASVIFTDIVDNYPQHAAYPDALFLLAESLFKANDYLGARGRYRMIIEHADQPAYRPHVQRALGRLIEIAIHIRDFEGVEDYFTRLSKLPPTEVEAATNYFRAKYLYSTAIGEAESAEGDVATAQVNQERLEQARLAFEAVAPRSPYYGQARYFVGVIYLLRGQLAPAIDAFKRVSVLPVESEDQRRIKDLSELAVGRLQYELDQLEPAVETYQKVSRNSPVFDTALYEIAWVYIRMGDSTRAERALEVLSVAVPDSQHIPDAKLLRGNLLLRDGHFRTATEVFGEVSGQFGPVRDQLDRVLTEHEDANAYFRSLVRQNLDVFDVSAFLPPQAQRWAEAEGDMRRAMDTLSDLSQARQLVGETEGIVARLTGAISSPNPVNVFRDLRTQRESAVVLRNRLARTRKDLVALDEKSAKQYGNAELDQLRARKKELERSLAGTPIEEEDLQQRTYRVVRQFDGLGKDLSKLEVDLLGMEARIAATERFVSDTGKGRDPQAMEAVRAELATQKAAVADYRKQIEALEVQLETGRLQVGVGDQDFAREEGLRKEYNALVDRERQVLRSLGAQPDAGVEDAFRLVASIEGRLDSYDGQIDVIVRERVDHMRAVLGEESVKLQGYRTQLAQLETESEDVVGGVALANFHKVRDRFYDLVLRADVGVIDVAWAVREEHRMRAETLSRERARAIKALEDEYREIVDQSEGQR